MEGVPQGRKGRTVKPEGPKAEVGFWGGAASPLPTSYRVRGSAVS